MWDFRAWRFPPEGALAMMLWLAFLAVGTVAGLARRTWRPMALGLLAALCFNLLFHLSFQLRGSLTIYTGHVNFLVFALGAGLAHWVGGNRWGRIAYVASVLVLAGLVAVNNVPVVVGFVTGFDTPDTSCPAPCSDDMP
jgi:hypothetical protein